MLQFAQIYETANTSPSFKHPPLWIIMAGCDGAYIDLAPSDIDGDTVKCRWGTSVESGGATYDNQLWPSLSLDEDNCIVSYTGSLDKSKEGVKPIGLMIEDFDSNGNVKSSIPVQFLAQVWTPNLNSRAVGVANYPDWFRGPDHDDHRDYVHNQDYHPPVRGKRSNQPAYCDAVPKYTENTPLDGDILDGSDGVVDFILEASSQLGEITSFSYEGPLGVKCSDNVVDGKIKCTWELTEDQLEIENHGFCYTATDSFGLTTERRCINIQGRGNIPIVITSTTTSTTTTTNTSTTSTTSTTTTSTTTTSTTTTTTTTKTTTTTSKTSTTALITTTTVTTFITTTSPSTGIIKNIHEMASFLLDGNDGGVLYKDAVNYGCNGQDFDPFAKNSKPVDHTDKAFLNWKNCIQCALGMKAENIPIYSYSADQDSCGEFIFATKN